VTEPPPPRSRGTAFLQVLVAALFLAVIGASAGLALGLRERDRDDSAGRDADRTAQQVPPTTPAWSPSPAEPEVGKPTISPTPPAAACEQRVVAQVGRKDLTQVLYLETELSEVWICRNGIGALYYVGLRLSDEAWLVLTDVEEQAEEYVATNVAEGARTVYRVSAQRLVIDTADGGTEVQDAVSAGG
jgi:hypothetical protein